MSTYLYKTVRAELAAAAALTVLKAFAALWCGSIVLFAHAAYSAAALVMLPAVMPGSGWTVSSGPGACSRARCAQVLTVLVTVVPVLGIITIVLRTAVAGLIAGTAEIDAAILLGVVLIFAAAEIILFYRLSTRGRCSHSLAIAALAGQLRGGISLLLIVPAASLAEQLGCYFAAGLAAAGLVVLILRLLLEMLYSLPIKGNAEPPEFLLREIRRRVLTLKEVQVAGKIRGRLERGRLVLHLELIPVEGLSREEQDRLRESARQKVLNSFCEVSQVYCAVSTLTRRRALLLRMKQ